MNLSRYTVLFDACVLYPAPLRDLLIQLASAELFRAKWTDAIHDEWIAALLRKRPELDHIQLHRTRKLMDQSVMDCLVTGYEDLIGALVLPDPDDRHVLAAAIVAGADSIVTYNLRDFPQDTVGQYNIEVQHPDDFIHHQIGLDDAAVIVSAQKCRARLTSPPVSAADYLARLGRQSLSKTVGALTPFIEVL